VISIHDSQKDARNIEQSFALGHRNVNCLQYEKAVGCNDATTNKNEDSFASRPIEPECETERVPLDPRVLDKAMTISQDLSANEDTELLSFLDKNNDIFAWQTSDLIGASRDIIEHKQVNPSTRPKRQKLSKMSGEKVVAAKAEV
jgi:hypothetical protein